jgi:hypothetical protein
MSKMAFLVTRKRSDRSDFWVQTYAVCTPKSSWQSVRIFENMSNGERVTATTLQKTSKVQDAAVRWCREEGVLMIARKGEMPVSGKYKKFDQIS